MDGGALYQNSSWVNSKCIFFFYTTYTDDWITSKDITLSAQIYLITRFSLPCRVFSCGAEHWMNGLRMSHIAQDSTTRISLACSNQDIRSPYPCGMCYFILPSRFNYRHNRWRNCPHFHFPRHSFLHSLTSSSSYVNPSSLGNHM